MARAGGPPGSGEGSDLGKENPGGTEQAGAEAAQQPYGGYHQTWSAAEDAELTHVGPGTPCGEYLRRFWHPVAITEQLGDVPRLIRILGEDLVLYRDKGGRIGLLHKHCAHRRASLEYGVCEDRGLRCCYHGWLFDADGTILETPGEPANSEAAAKLRRTLRQGAYPVREFRGLIFAYMGPPEARPDFPHYDAYDIPGMTMTPYETDFPCNWVQVLDAIVDPVHTSFLHSRVSRLQFSQGFGEVGELDFYERSIRIFGTNTRRVGENVWIRVNELIMPNFTQAGAAFAADGTKQRYFGRSSFTRWVVPLDDTNTKALAWGNFGERGDPPEWNTPEGREKIEQGEVFDRPYEERQRFPGDYEAVTGMGPISIHKKEHLAPCDRGVALFRSRLRRAIRALGKGKAPVQPSDLAGGAIPTYGGDTVLHLPSGSNRDDRPFLRAVQAKVMELHFEADSLQGEARDRFMIEELRKLEAAGGT